MVKLFSVDHSFNHSFNLVSSAFWRKYPNSEANHIQAIDVYDRKLINIPKDSNSNESDICLLTNRIVSCESNIPSWLSSLGKCFILYYNINIISLFFTNIHCLISLYIYPI